MRSSKCRRAAMPDDVLRHEPFPQRSDFWRVPLFRLLAINLAAGIVLAALLVGGLLVLNPRWTAGSDLRRQLARHRARAIAVRVRDYLRLRRDGDSDHDGGEVATVNVVAVNFRFNCQTANQQDVSKPLHQLRSSSPGLTR